MPTYFEAGAGPMPAHQLQQDIEGGFLSVGAHIDAEHNPQGGHTDVTADSVTTAAFVTSTLTTDEIDTTTDGALLEVNAGLRFITGPWVFENDGNNVALAVVQVPQITGDQNNYHPTNLETAIVLELSSDAARTITGLYATRQRRLLYLVNRGNYTITLSHVSGSSTSTYQFAFSSLLDFELRAGGMIALYYDAGSELWRAETPEPPPEIPSMSIAVQYGTITFTNGGANNPTATLSPTVDTEKAVLHYLGASADTSGFTARVTLENSSTVRANRDGAHNTVSAVVSFCVAEWDLS